MNKVDKKINRLIPKGATFRSWTEGEEEKPDPRTHSLVETEGGLMFENLTELDSAFVEPLRIVGRLKDIIKLIP